MNFVFNVEDEKGKVCCSSYTLSHAIKKFIELSNEKSVLLEVYHNGVNTFTYGMYKNDNLTDETIIKSNICDGMFG